MKHYTYILQCADGSFYAGCTNNLEKRIKQHNESKRGARYTKTRRPVKLVYNELFATLAGARRRETEIKGWNRAKKQMLIDGNRDKAHLACLGRAPSRHPNDLIDDQ